MQFDWAGWWRQGPWRLVPWRVGPRRLAIALIAGVLAGCSPLAVINQLGSDRSIAQTQTPAYGQAPRQQIDAYTPARPSGITVVFLHGGGWSSGARGDYRFMAQQLTARGATVFIPDYRLYPDVRFPTFVEDSAAAVAWAYSHAADYGGDPAQFYVVGHSAGAHIAALLALDPHYLAAQHMQPPQLKGVVGLSTPADFAATLGQRYRPIFTDTHDLALAQPIRYVNAEAPPLLLLHGLDDDVVYPKNSIQLAARQKAAGGQVTLHTYPDMNHIGTLTGFIPWVSDKTARDAVLDFLGLPREPLAP